MTTDREHPEQPPAEQAGDLGAQLEAARRLNEQVFANPAVKLLIRPPSGEIVDANPAAEQFYGYSVDELRQLTIYELNQLPLELVREEMERARSENRTYFEFRHRLASGELRDVQVYSGPVEVDGETLLFSIICDITERKRLADELAHVQRMEPLGRLAGGVAHDFNNLLQAMGLVTSLARRRVEDPRAASLLDEMANLVQRGAGLTRQLLAFCRKQVAQPVLLDLVQHVRSCERLLGRALGEHFELELLGAGPAPVVADPTQVEQVLLNLAINARDAMDGAGRVQVVVLGVELEPGEVDGLEAGPYVQLSVIDEGGGMDAEVLSRVFEPFYSTKRTGEGAGLGLATVSTIVRGSGGEIRIQSAPGQGTRVDTWWPKAGSEPVELAAERAPAAPAPASACRVLLVDDDDAVRASVASILEDHGFVVARAGSGDLALEMLRATDEPFELLLTDVVMPRMNGLELARIASGEQPELRMLYMSGYVESPILRRNLLDAGGAFLQKPFDSAGLLEAVARVMAAPPRPVGSER